MRHVGLAIIGAGAVVERYLEVGLLDRRDEVDLHYVYSRGGERARAMAARIGAAPTTDLSTVLKDPRVEAVMVSTPHATHAGIVIAALAAGKHVLVEKPIATKLADARQMVLAAQRTGRVLAVFENYHFFEPFVRGGEMIRRGEIGSLVAIRATLVAYLGEFWMREGWRGKGEAAGILLDQACHYIDGLRVLAGEEITDVAAIGSVTRPDFEAEDTLMLNLRFASGLVGQAFLTFGSLTSDFRSEAEVFGSQGSLRVHPVPEGLVLYQITADSQRRLSSATRISRRGGEEVVGRPGRRAILASSSYDGSFLPPFSDFLAAVRGEKEPAMSGLEGFRDLAVVEAAGRSLKSGRVEAVEQF